ncbi:MAG: hypothetical protein HC866_15620 [Leptolyngbyaceae cyanobacterium RU_5_1]|nr:hypothetical protein [Leptolyngbyaceae cyanobacterium RU_5_1]
MDFSTVLPPFVITLREGVEAALVVGIVLACLRKAGQANLNRWVYLGVMAGLAVSALIGLLFGWMIKLLGAASPVAEPLLEGVFYYERFTKVHSCILGSKVWDFKTVLPDDQFPGVILNALFGYTQRLYLVQAIAYLLFLSAIGGVYFQSLSGRVFFTKQRFL